MMKPDVLVVEDDEATRAGLVELLAAAGFQVTEAGDGRAALAELNRHEFGVVLMDVQLPRLGGLEVLSRSRSEGSVTKIIIMTGLDATDTVLSALRQHAWEFIPKPIDPSRLIDSVQRALSTTHVVPPIEVISATPEWVELLVPCTREAVDRIQSFVQRLETDLADDVRESVGLAFRELLTNGIEWGGRLDPAQRVRVACVRTPRMLLYRINDPGPGFSTGDASHAAGAHSDPLAHDDIRREKGLRPGGFGLVLIRAIADELVYNERRNEVIFVKYLVDVPAT